MTKSELLQTAKPILFNTEMVKAILEGRKTVTRRVVKPQPGKNYEFNTIYIDGMIAEFKKTHQADPLIDCAEYLKVKLRYQPGDILYVRETFRHVIIGEVDYEGECMWDDEVLQYKASENEFKDKYDCFVDSYPSWRPSIHMPKSAARLFLKVTDVRVERLQDISMEGARTEGAINRGLQIGLEGFIALWNSTIKKQDLALYGWEANPWVWVYEFERVEA